MSIRMDDLLRLFPSRNRINDPTLKFNTVSAFAQKHQPKGIFIPLYEQSGELLKAIENGAIAALWKVGTPIPPYTPNQFFIFYTDDLWKGLKNMLELYSENSNNDHEIGREEKVTFHLLGEKNRQTMENKKNLVMDIKELEHFMERINNQKEGI